MSRFPCVTLYTFQDITPDISEALNRINASLGSKGLPQGNIEIVHLGDDRNLAKKIVENSGKFKENTPLEKFWPFVYIDAKPIGTEQDLDNWLLFRGDFQDIPDITNSPITFYTFKNTSLIPAGVVQKVEHLDKVYRELRQQHSILLSNNQLIEAEALRTEIQELRNQIEKILQQNSKTSSSQEEYSPKIDISLLVNLSPSDFDPFEDAQIYDMNFDDEENENAKKQEENREEVENEGLFAFDDDPGEDFTSLPDLVSDPDSNIVSDPVSDPIPTSCENEMSRSVVASTLGGVSTYFKSALNYVGLSPTPFPDPDPVLVSVPVSSEEIPSVPLTPPVSPDPVLADFPVLQTNWYYRQQVRILRFYEHYFSRVNPTNQEVRASHKYSDITKIVRQANYFTLHFKQEAPEEYCPQGSFQEILDLFKIQHPSLIIEGI